MKYEFWCKFAKLWKFMNAIYNMNLSNNKRKLSLLKNMVKF